MSKLRAQGSLWPSVCHFSGKVGRTARNQFDVWVPLALNLEKLQRNTHFLRVFARFKPGVTLTQAQADLNVVAANLALHYPEWNKNSKSVRHRDCPAGRLYTTASI
ncbi:MAG: hypothetical protein DMG10_12600 [Acidobacteria bacterium]|nr:MAG: hypothetical protein DMG10_12600 [Acidobacteriota bacterium]